MLAETQPSVPRNLRSTEPVNAAETVVCLLGGFRLLHRDQPHNVLAAGKAMALLSMLALHLDAGLPREVLLDQLWPDQDALHSRTSLNSLVYSLHRRLRFQAHDTAAVVYENGSYYLNRAAGFSTDVALFDRFVGYGDRLAAFDITKGAHVYEQAVALYRGDLCIGTDVYAVIERERLRASFLTVLAWLAEAALRRDDAAAALGYALRLLAYDPCREDAHRVVMRAQVRLGARAQALRQYRLCEQVLRREYDTGPEPATTELFERIRLDPAHA